ncbi:L-aspartate oxidase, partial [Pseudoalteromonas sp. S2893]
GAHRMASNSILECIVFAHAAPKDILSTLEHAPTPHALPSWDESRVSYSDEEIVISHYWHELLLFMWAFVG